MLGQVAYLLVKVLTPIAIHPVEKSWRSIGVLSGLLLHQSWMDMETVIKVIHLDLDHGKEDSSQ